VSAVRSFAAFLYDFVVGDDPLIALGIAIGIALTAAVAAADIASWWLLPLAVVALLGLSLRRAARR
jgi:hypothetical protein